VLSIRAAPVPAHFIDRESLRVVAENMARLLGGCPIGCWTEDPGVAVTFPFRDRGGFAKTEKMNRPPMSKKAKKLSQVQAAGEAGTIHFQMPLALTRVLSARSTSRG
jgi:hypothetical protein